ncbi:uncharacterized protein [Haliotis asinina]|uniref:uncharacterized protein isoform X2 n=1 Tax=Haliotis asinina TaxID=109174 RepID=UPI00353205B2
MTPRLHRMTACVTVLAVAVVVKDAVEAFSHTTSIGFSASTPGIQYYDEGGNALFINEAFPLVSGRLIQICFYIHKNFDMTYTGTFFVFKKTERGYRLIFQQNVVFPKTQGRHCESGTMVANNVPDPLMVGQTYGSRSFTKTYFFMVEAIIDIGSVGVLGTAGQIKRTGYPGVRGAPGIMGVADMSREDGRNGIAGTPGQKNVGNRYGPKGLPGDAVTTGPVGDAVATGPVGDAVATGPVGDAVATGPVGDAVATGPASDSSGQTTGYNYDFWGRRVNLSDSEKMKLITKEITMHCCEDGAPGITGSTGVTGLRGPAGYTGLTGLPGSKGDNGMHGETGRSGQDGLSGATGPVGASGDAGPPGVSGITGLTGQRGPVGITGVSGSRGSRGPVGPAAVTGQTGSTGPIGETGPPGLTGTRGDAGATGVTGLRGEPGATGPKGELFKYPDKCKMTPSPCEQICVNIGISHECRCREGYSLAADKSRCVDVDECMTEGPCEQLCKNTEGSFTCSCRPGYNLTENRRNCEDFDECKHNVCPYQSFRMAQICKNTIGSFVCIGFGIVLSDLDREHVNSIHYDFQPDVPSLETPATLKNLVRTTNVLTILVGCLLGVVLIIVIAVVLLAYKTRKTSNRSPSVYRLHPEIYGSRGNLSPRSDAECGVGHERTYVQQPYPGMTL